MSQAITVLAPIKLASGKNEDDLITASKRFQNEFVDQQSGILRRELVRQGEGVYLDIIQFRSQQDVEEVMLLEQESPACHAFIAVMDMSAEDPDAIKFCPSLATYNR